MRLPLLKFTTVALLGVWNAFPSTEGAPAGLSRSDSRPDATHGIVSRGIPVGLTKVVPVTTGGPENELGAVVEGSASSKPKVSAGPPPASVPASRGPINPFDNTKYAYTQEKVSTEDPVEKTWGQLYWVRTKNFEPGPLDEIFINTETKTITVKDSINIKETVPKDSPKKAFLSDLQANLYKMEGGSLNDLKVVNYPHVIEEDTEEILRAVRGGRDDILTFKSDSTGQDKDTFNKLMITKFPKGINRMISQYSIKNPDGKSKQITQFDIYPNKDIETESGMTVHIG